MTTNLAFNFKIQPKPMIASVFQKILPFLTKIWANRHSQKMNC